jgi:hypothetical protein
VAEVNSHLDSVVSLWREIGERMGQAAREAGLFATSQPLGDFADTYWPEQVVAAIWHEREAFAKRMIHTWDSVRIVEEDRVLPMSSLRHSPESVHTFVLESSDMVRSQNLGSLRAFLESWEREALRVDSRIADLASERSRIEARANEFRGLLETLRSNYSLTSRLSGECPTCRPWLGELNQSGVSQ